ncbi:MAG TPA: hypothetical protein VGK17_19585, partial [Propionicimonas sp.]
MTLVTLECTPVDIATSVSEAADAAYPSAVLHPRGQFTEHRGSQRPDRRRGIAGATPGYRSTPKVRPFPVRWIRRV